MDPQVPVEFDSYEDVEFHYSTPDVNFVLVLTERPDDQLVDFEAVAMWGAALPKVAASRASRLVHWSDGHRIAHGVWQPEPGHPEPDVSLTFYALVIAVQGDQVVDGSQQVIAFRVGSLFPHPGTACDRNLTIAARSEPMATNQCAYPSLTMVCADNACRVICLTSEACIPPEQCTLKDESGLRVCEAPPL